MIITANSRLSRVLQQAYDSEQIANGMAVWTAPDILPFGAWLERCWRTWLHGSHAVAESKPAQLLSPLQERVIWEGIVARSDSGNALLQIAATADAALDAWNLAQAWNLPLDAREWNDSRDTEAFHAWAIEFQRLCKSRNWLPVSQLPEFIAARMTAGEIDVPADIQLAGFAEWTPVQEGLLEAMRQRGANVENRSTAPNRPASGSAVRIGFADTIQEIRAAARWARMHLESAAQAGMPEPAIGIVVPELSKIRSAVERLFAEELHPGSRLAPDRDFRRAFNISLGPDLSEYPLIQAALQILRMNPAELLPIADVQALLRCPFIANAQSESSARALLDIQLRKKREPELSFAEIEVGAPAGLKSALDGWEREQRKHASRQMPSGWAAAFSAELKAMGWPGERPLNSAEHQTLAAWNEMLSEFASLDSASGVLTRGFAVSMLQRTATSRLFQPESETAPIQVLGVFESSGMTFDHLWILGMHDGAWPRSATANPFLPRRLQLDGNLPESSPHRALEFSRILSEQLLASSTDVVVSHPTADGDAALRPSPLFLQLPEASIEDLHLRTFPGHAELLYRSSSIERIDDHIAPSWTGTRARGGAALFTQQAACPFQAFARVRLGARTLDAAEPGLTAIDRGNLVHDVFRRIWNELGSHETLMGAAPTYLAAVIHDEVHAAISRLMPLKRALQRSRFAAIEQARLERLATEWLELEKQRQPFIVLGQEMERPVTVGGVDLIIRADRIDRLEDGTYVILDYKTSRHRPSEWDGTRPDNPQLPLYAITADVPIGGVVFGIARLGEIRFTGLTASDGTVPGVKSGVGEDALQNQMPAWREVLEQLATDFRSGKAMVNPKDPNQSCRICGLQSLCRISESDSLEASND